jgi:D-arabinose 1-dehydrogenase-like Zn-dependent alcohol dehydrogenase
MCQHRPPALYPPHPRQETADSEDTLRFSELAGISSMNEIFPFEQAQAAYDRMLSGQARFRVVLKMD